MLILNDRCEFQPNNMLYVYFVVGADEISSSMPASTSAWQLQQQFDDESSDDDNAATVP